MVNAKFALAFSKHSLNLGLIIGNAIQVKVRLIREKVILERTEKRRERFMLLRKRFIKCYILTMT